MQTKPEAVPKLTLLFSNLLRTRLSFGRPFEKLGLVTFLVRHAETTSSAIADAANLVFSRLLAAPASSMSRARQIINAATADLQNLRLLRDGKLMVSVNHRFALSNPTLVGACPKKSFSSVNSPIFACNDFRSTGGVLGAAPPDPNTSAALPLSCAFQVVI
jgi:hypothetical protein